jgi:hypothetical protein
LRLKAFDSHPQPQTQKNLTAKIAKKIRQERKENAESKPFRQFREG